MSGKTASKKTARGRLCAILSRASSPTAAVSTSNPLLVKIAVAIWSISGESSTTRIVLLFMRCPLSAALSSRRAVAAGRGYVYARVLDFTTTDINSQVAEILGRSTHAGSTPLHRQIAE